MITTKRGNFVAMKNLIKEFRKQAGISQTALAAAAGWTQSRVSNYERSNRVPGIGEGRELCRAFADLGVRVTLDDLFPPDSEAA